MMSLSLRKAGLALLLCGAASAFAQPQPAPKFEPYSGQPGKDVVWVPTGQELVGRMLDMAKVTSNDIVFDLGSGDGRTVIAAARRGATATGIEYEPEMVELSKKNAAAAGVSARATFVKADLFETDFSKATVITMYLLTSINLKLRPTLLNLKPGTRIVSHAFDMGNWAADQIETRGGTAYLWIVPAKVAGTWTWLANGQAYEVKLDQKYQELSGKATIGGKPAQLRSARITGDQITLSIEDGGATREFTGRVNGGAIDGTARAGGAPLATPSKWTATGKLEKTMTD
ncbi:MAG: methyltransferase domain-containing protein [Burkholderiales bacterium]